VQAIFKLLVRLNNPVPKAELAQDGLLATQLQKWPQNQKGIIYDPSHVRRFAALVSRYNPRQQDSICRALGVSELLVEIGAKEAGGTPAKMNRRVKAALNRDKANLLNKAWGVGAVQARYSDDGHWYANLSRFPAALFDPHGYVYFATEADYRAAPMSIGKQIGVPRPGISAMPGYLRVTESQFTTKPAADLESPPAERVKTTVSRIVRDTRLSIRVKTIHKYKCQLCGSTLLLTDGSQYAEAQHLQPLGSPHNGPDVLGNIVCLCPNCHALCDFGAIELVRNELRVTAEHVVAQRYIDYHNSSIYRGRNRAKQSASADRPRHQKRRTHKPIPVTNKEEVRAEVIKKRAEIERNLTHARIMKIEPIRK
jgi:hypothetical protein